MRSSRRDALRWPSLESPASSAVRRKQIAIPGNFSSSRHITGSEGLRRQIMQDALPAFVLHSEAKRRSTMNDAPRDSETRSSQTPQGGEHPQSDEQLMVAFSRGQTEAFSALFARYKQPLFGFFRRRVADRKSTRLNSSHL